MYLCVYKVFFCCVMGKGRDKELIRLRDEALCRRYYHWTEVERLRFDDALKVLSEREFFISEERILSIIRRKLREGTDRVFTVPGRVRCPRLAATGDAMNRGHVAWLRMAQAAPGDESGAVFVFFAV